MKRILSTIIWLTSLLPLFCAAQETMSTTDRIADIIIEHIDALSSDEQMNIIEKIDSKIKLIENSRVRNLLEVSIQKILERKFNSYEILWWTAMYFTWMIHHEFWWWQSITTHGHLYKWWEIQMLERIDLLWETHSLYPRKVETHWLMTLNCMLLDIDNWDKLPTKVIIKTSKWIEASQDCIIAYQNSNEYRRAYRTSKFSGRGNSDYYSIESNTWDIFTWMLLWFDWIFSHLHNFSMWWEGVFISKSNMYNSTEQYKSLNKWSYIIKVQHWKFSRNGEANRHPPKLSIKSDQLNRYIDFDIEWYFHPNYAEVPQLTYTIWDWQTWNSYTWSLNTVFETSQSLISNEYRRSPLDWKEWKAYTHDSYIHIGYDLETKTATIYNDRFKLHFDLADPSKKPVWELLID